jgi:hypothetical protein
MRRTRRGDAGARCEAAYTRALRYAECTPPPLTRPNLVIDVLLTWAGASPSCVLATAQVPRGARFLLGESGACDAIVPSEALRATSLDVIRWDHDAATLVAPEGALVSRDGEPVSSPTVVLGPSQLVEIAFGDFVLSARLAAVERVAGLRRAPRGRGLGGIAVSAAAHVACLALALAAASHDKAHGDELSLSQLRIMRHLLEASAARDPVVNDDAPSRHATLGNDAAHAFTSPLSPRATATAALPAGLSPEPAATSSEPTLSGEGDGAINVKDVGGLLASLERRLSVPLQGGFAHVANTRDSPQDSLRSPYPIVSDGRLDTDTVRRVVRASTRNLLSCLPDAPRARGHVAVTFTVGSFGQVVAAHDVGGDVTPDVRACIVRGFYGLVFPAPERGGATLTYPLSLAPDG